MMIPSTNDLKTITDLRENTMGILNAVQKKSEPTIIMHRNSPKAVMLSVNEYNRLIEIIDDHMDELIAMELDKEPYDSKNYVSEKDALKKLGIKLK